MSTTFSVTDLQAKLPDAHARLDALATIFSAADLQAKRLDALATIFSAADLQASGFLGCPTPSRDDIPR
jgi:hypothetical protein